VGFKKHFANILRMGDKEGEKNTINVKRKQPNQEKRKQERICQ
jgi:hypothetical protein